MVKQPEDQFDEQGSYILFDPLCDGNCQFSSVCRILREFGFQRPPEALRAEIVSYLEVNPNDTSGTPLDFDMDDPFSNYLNRMRIDGTFDDKIILKTALELFNIEFVIISALDRPAEATRTPQNFAPPGRVYLGHFAENNGEHYVVLNPVEDPHISNESFDFEVKKTTNKSIANPIKNFDKPNKSVHFEVEKYTDKSFSNLSPELVDKILITAIRSCDNT